MREIKISVDGKQKEIMTERKGVILGIVAGIVAFIFMLCLFASIDAIRKAASTEYISYKNYQKIKVGMSYREVVRILDGHEGEYERESFFGYISEYYVWSNDNGTIKVEIEDGVVESKEEENLYDPAIEIYELFFSMGISFLVFSLSIILIKKKRQKDIQKINKGANEQLIKCGFKSQTVYTFEEFKNGNAEGYNKFIAIDNEDKTICFVDYQKYRIILTSFDEILNYEVYENGCEISNGTTIAGGMLLGRKKRFGVGTALTSTTSQKSCTELRLIVRIKSYSTPQVAYDLVSGKLFSGITATSSEYTRIIASLQEVVSFLEILIDENDKKQNALG